MENQKLKCSVIMLPQPKGEYKLPFIAKTSMGTSSSLKIAWWTEIFRTPYEPQFLYLVSDQEIKVGDFVVEILTNKELDIFEIHTLNDINEMSQRKIVASMDPRLSLPKIPQGFVDKYIEKEGKIEEVMIETVTGGINRIVTVPVTRPDDTVIISKVKTQWSKEELFLVIYDCLGHFAEKHNITISGQDLTDWADEHL